MTEKFTKGPWRIEGDIVKTAISAGVKHIAMVNYFDCGPGDPRSIAKEEHEANAHLIQAAPDLYTALYRTCHNALDLGYCHMSDCYCCPSMAALKKARGEK